MYPVLQNGTLLFMAFVLTCVAGIVEAKEYVYSFDGIKNNDLSKVSIAFLIYSVGIIIDFIAISLLKNTNFFVPEILAMLFMAVVIIGIAVFSGQFFKWSALDQAVACMVFGGLLFLAYRHE